MELNNLDPVYLPAVHAALPQQEFSELGFKLRPIAQLEILSDGQQIERFENGGEILRDALGRVVEVWGPHRECLSLSYDSSGNFDAFMRTDPCCEMHSEGSRDKQGISVRNAEGNICLTGESMTVDAVGCLYIYIHDGQFVALDLIGGVHLERRLISCPDGGAYVLTAVFANFDGFRMATRFHRISEISKIGENALSANVSEWDRFRYYGRDGLLVEFDSVKAVRSIQPSRVHRLQSVLPEKTSFEPNWQNQYQNITNTVFQGQVGKLV